jgi:hypothetical protein
MLPLGQIGVVSPAPETNLSKLRAKGLVVRVLGSRRYRLLPEGYRLSVVLLKLFHKLYAPLSSGLLEPFPADRNFPPERTQQLDKLYRAVSDSLDQLVDGLGLKAA